MLFAYLIPAPPAGPVEFGHDVGAVFLCKIVHPVLVAVQRLAVSRGLEAFALHGLHDHVRAQIIEAVYSGDIPLLDSVGGIAPAVRYHHYTPGERKVNIGAARFSAARRRGRGAPGPVGRGSQPGPRVARRRPA